MSVDTVGGLEKTFRVLAGTRSEMAYDALRAAMHDPDEAVRLGGARSLLRWGRESGLVDVVRLFSSFSESARRELAAQGDRMRQALRIALRSEDEGLRAASVEALAYLRGPEALELTKTALLDRSVAVATRAAEAFETCVREFLARKQEIEESVPGAPSGAPVMTEALAELQREEKAVLSAMQSALEAGHVHNQVPVLLAALDLGAPGFELVWAPIRHAHMSSHFLSSALSVLDDERCGRFLAHAVTNVGEAFPEALRSLLCPKKHSATFRGFAGRLVKADLGTLADHCRAWADIPWWNLLEAHLGEAAEDFLRQSLNLAQAVYADAAERSRHVAVLAGASQAVVTRAVFNALAGDDSGEADKDALSSAIDAALGSPDVQVQMMAVDRALSDAEIPDRHALLVKALNSPHGGVRKKAAHGLTAGKKERFLAAFDELDERTQQMAGQAIAKIDEGFVDELSEDLGAVEEHRRLKALKVISAIGREKDVRERVVELMRDPSKLVRSYAVNMLVAFGGVEAMKALIAALDDPDRRVKANAIEAFEALGNPKVIDLLLPFLRHEDNRVRTTAAKALWNLGRRDVADLLVEMLGEDDELMRLSAVWAIGELENMDHRRELLEKAAQEDPSERVREKARSVLDAPGPAAG